MQALGLLHEVTVAGWAAEDFQEAGIEGHALQLIGSRALRLASKLEGMAGFPNARNFRAIPIVVSRCPMDRFWTQHYEPGVPADLALEKVTVLELFERTVANWGDRPAVSFKGKTLSYHQLEEQVNRFATALSRLGVKRDSRVALWLPNLPQMVIAYFATLRLGAQVVNTNPLYVERELEHQFNDAGVSVVITLDYLWWYKLRALLPKTQVKQVVVTSIPDYLPFPLNLLAPLKLKKTKQFVRVPKEAGVHFFKDLLAQSPPTPPKVEIGLEDLAVLQYTGGTTGVSKGAMLTHGNLTANVQQSASWFPSVRPGEEVLLACLPYFHVFGMTISMLWPVSKGGHIVLVPNPRDIPELVKSIRKYRVTIFPAVPALFVAINNFKGVDQIDLSSVRACFSGSAPLPVEVLERFEKLTGGKITEGFGMTETSPVTHANPLLGLRKPGSIGIPRARNGCKNRGCGNEPNRAWPRPGRRTLRSRPPGHGGLLESARRNRPGPARWLDAHR